MTQLTRWQTVLVVVLLGLAGGAIAWIDTRPDWDDTGVTAFAVVICAGLGALALPAWLAATLVAAPIVAWEFSGNSGVLMAAVVAVAGAYGGKTLGRLNRT